MPGKKLFLQPRLRMLADLIPQNARLSDVGTDHGYVPVSLLLDGRIQHAIASDIGARPLEHARRTASEYDVSDQIEFRLCAGLADISPVETDCILIAGMGGETIIGILKEAPWTAKMKGLKLILQPQTRQELLRCWLAENGYRIEREYLALDKDTLYNIFSVVGGSMETPDAAEQYSGIRLSDDPHYSRYLNAQISRLEKAVSGLSQARNNQSGERAQELAEIIQELKKRKGDAI